MAMDLPTNNQLRNNGIPLRLQSLLPHPSPRGCTIASENQSADRGESPSLQTIGPNTGSVISKIEDIFESIADRILDKKKNDFHFKLKIRRKSEDSSTPTFKNISFPCKSEHEAWRFCVFFKILEMCHEALVTGVITTKRDIYYRDPDLFKMQAIVDRYVDDIAYSLNVDRQSLNVVAAAKGLVVGSFTIRKSDHTLIDFASNSEGMLVPATGNIDSFHLTEICWVLIIEKEATFRTLAADMYWRDSLAGTGMLVTAKGYPDIQTRRFLHLVSTQRQSIPIFTLVDFDPDGIGIMSTYKHGSLSLKHENANLIVPGIHWLGIQSEDVIHSRNSEHKIIRLTSRDRKIALKMLKRKVISSGEEDQWMRELQLMLMLNIKAEIQSIGSSTNLTSWLDCKLVNHLNALSSE